MEWIPAVATSVVTLAAAVIGGIFLYVRTRVERTPNNTEVRQADVAANHLLVTLLDRTERELDRADRIIKDLRETISEMETAGAALRHALGEAEESRTQIASLHERLKAALEHLRRKAEVSLYIASGEVVIWIDNALDLSVPLLNLLDLPEDVSMTIRTMEEERTL